MELIIEGNLEIEEIKIEDLLKQSSDMGKVISPKPLEINGEGRAENRRDDVIKEMIARDTLEMGAREAAALHGVSKTAANEYSNGNGFENPESRQKILAEKHNIADLAVAKLMDTLNLFDPDNLDKETDKIKAAGTLASIVEKISSKDRDDKPVVILQLYSPKQKKLDDYPVIDV